VSFRLFVGSILRKAAALGGFALIRPEYKFGIDPFVDVKRLAFLKGLPIDCIIDVGANDGDSALRLFEIFPETPVVSFEPHPATYAKLMKRIGPRRNFSAINLALGSREAEVELFENASDKLNSLVWHDTRASHVSVTCTTLDAYCTRNDIKRVGLLKIDTEGSDLEVLRGGENMLARKTVSFVYVEFSDLQGDEFSGALLPMDNFLRPLGYRFVTAYVDSIRTDLEFSTTSNALFILAP
jgi:FkbM family methyltransferase